MVTADPPLNVDPDAAPVPPLLKVRALGVFAVMVISAEPLKLTPLMFLAVASVVAVPALPVIDPVIVLLKVFAPPIV